MGCFMDSTSSKYPIFNIFPIQNFDVDCNTKCMFHFLSQFLFIAIISKCLLPVWRFLLQKKELNIIGESIDVNKVIDMDSHFKGQLTIQYLPDSSAKMNPFHFDQVCLGLENNHLIEMPIEFNTTSGIGYLQIQHTTPDNEIQYLNYTGGSLRKLFRKDYSHLSKYSEYNRNKIQGCFIWNIQLLNQGCIELRVFWTTRVIVFVPINLNS